MFLIAAMALAFMQPASPSPAAAPKAAEPSADEKSKAELTDWLRRAFITKVVLDASICGSPERAAEAKRGSGAIDALLPDLNRILGWDRAGDALAKGGMQGFNLPKNCSQSSFDGWVKVLDSQVQALEAMIAFHESRSAREAR